MVAWQKELSSRSHWLAGFVDSFLGLVFFSPVVMCCDSVLCVIGLGLFCQCEALQNQNAALQ